MRKKIAFLADQSLRENILSFDKNFCQNVACDLENGTFSLSSKDVQNNNFKAQLGSLA